MVMHESIDRVAIDTFLRYHLGPILLWRRQLIGQNLGCTHIQSYHVQYFIDVIISATMDAFILNLCGGIATVVWVSDKTPSANVLTRTAQ